MNGANESERSLGRRYYEDLLTGGDIDVVDQIMDPEISFLGPITPDGLYGTEAYKRFALGWYKGFPDRRFQVVEEWVDGDRIAILFRITGTHQGEFMGQAPTGNSIDVTGMNFFHLHQGKIRAIQAFFNPLHLLEPIGLATSKNALELAR